jgi:thioredoxin family protein
MDIQWTDDVDAAMKKAKESKRPLLLDFTAAPM